jgi:small subunit ribosomal protein S6
MVIYDSNAYARDPNGVSGKVPAMVEKCGGEMLASRLWFEQKLAYPIAGQRKGTYWLSFFRMPSERVSDFNRECQLDDHVLRNLVLKVDPRTVEARVAQASGEVAAALAKSESTDTEGTKPAPTGDAGKSDADESGGDES